MMDLLAVILWVILLGAAYIAGLKAIGWSVSRKGERMAQENMRAYWGVKESPGPAASSPFLYVSTKAATCDLCGEPMSGRSGHAGPFQECACPLPET